LDWEVWTVSGQAPVASSREHGNESEISSSHGGEYEDEITSETSVSFDETAQRYIA
jgi:hypothetical protein